MKKILRILSESGNAHTGNHHLNLKATPMEESIAAQHARPLMKNDSENRDTGNWSMTAGDTKACAQSQRRPFNRTYDQLLDQQAICHALSREADYLPSGNLFLQQKYLKRVHRSQAMIYFSQLHDQYELKLTTLLLAGNILDRFLGLHTVSDALELYKAINCSAYLAMKIQEIYPPTMDELTKKADKPFLVGMAKYQQLIVSKLDFRLEKVSPINFFHTLPSIRKANAQEHFICAYLLELFMHDNELLGAYPFSLVAQALDHFLYILRTGSSKGWADTLERHSLVDIDRVAAYLFKSATTAKKYIREIYDKYAKPKYMSVSLNNCFIQGTKQ